MSPELESKISEDDRRKLESIFNPWKRHKPKTHDEVDWEFVKGCLKFRRFDKKMKANGMQRHDLNFNDCKRVTEIEVSPCKQYVYYKREIV
jgi:hypothetical protein